MDDKNLKYENRQYKEDNVERIFIAILFLSTFVLTLLSMFIFVWTCDFFGWMQTPVPVF